ncbi:Type 1 glutamine amidotransferase (GATase1) [Hydrobacter penzbergensis]|uniref:Type 1 glutamine amidotransferase (GATase1) n=1 Tax=Hydrobacter penzbergensis TaxID=1235997 RepID=A0A8X8IEL7_9BACT|nr:Type 1 glutamine amidotransferase (GATase1) [Hydrobacter penzbergensis]
MLIFLVASISAIYGFSQKQKTIDWKKLNVLVYSKNGKGYVHDNIPSAVAGLQDLGKKYGFKVDTSTNPSVFKKENLSKYQLLIFPSTNNEVFDTEEQRLAFRQYIEAGGGLVGIHSAIATERDWTWFKQFTGGTFSWHAPFQKFKVRVVDKNHPSVAGMPTVWDVEDECYFEKELYPSIHTFLVHDVTTLKPHDNIKSNMGSFKDYYPAGWHNYYDGGLAWMTTLGHDKKLYSDPSFMRFILQGIEFVATHRPQKLDYSKAYAKERNEPIQW